MQCDNQSSQMICTQKYVEKRVWQSELNIKEVFYILHSTFHFHWFQCTLWYFLVLSYKPSTEHPHSDHYRCPTFTLFVETSSSWVTLMQICQMQNSHQTEVHPLYRYIHFFLLLWKTSQQALGSVLLRVTNNTWQRRHMWKQRPVDPSKRRCLLFFRLLLLKQIRPMTEIKAGRGGRCVYIIDAWCWWQC